MSGIDRLKYWFFCFILLSLFLSLMFYSKIKHQQRIDDIFDRYEKSMVEINK